MDGNGLNGNGANNQENNAYGGNSAYNNNAAYDNTAHNGNAAYDNTAYNGNAAYDNTTYTTYGSGGMTSPIIEENKRGRGVLGALLGALLGGILWAIIGCFGYISGWIAALIFIFSQAGYRKLSGKDDKFGIILSVIFGLLVIIPATYFSYGFSLFQSLNEYGHFTYLEVLGDLPLYMERYELWGEFAGNLAKGYIFTGIIAIFMLVGNKDKKAKPQNNKNNIK